MPIWKIGPVLLTAALALGMGGLRAESGDRAAGESAAMPGAAPVKPWDREHACRWWLSDDDGKSLRASIGPGDLGMVLSVADPVFLEWPEDERPRAELIFDGDAGRSVSVDGWSTHIDNETAIFGLELDPVGTRMLAGASSLEIRRGGRTFLTLPLAATPGEATLLACVPPPESDSPDRE